MYSNTIFAITEKENCAGKKGQQDIFFRYDINTTMYLHLILLFSEEPVHSNTYALKRKRTITDILEQETSESLQLLSLHSLTILLQVE